MWGVGTIINISAVTVNIIIIIVVGFLLLLSLIYVIGVCLNDVYNVSYILICIFQFNLYFNINLHFQIIITTNKYSSYNTQTHILLTVTNNEKWN